MSNKRFRNPFEKYVAPTIAGAALVGGGVEAVTPPAKAEEYIGATEQEVTQVKPDVVRAQSVLAAVNEARAGQGLNPVTENPDLNAIAQEWAEYLVEIGDLQHRPNHWESYPDGVPGGGENLLQAWADFSAAKLVDMWMNSPNHRKKLLDPDAKTVGTGIAVGADGELFAVQNFGR
ncbi:CAP domain-containing protein [Corynebacterium macginleyi]|uniref:CAP domain-containing protein n=1 Tax=Corynebacterium macginleyi TaxID=38290 RepID=A0ABS1Y7G1_9CORY|nr:CAP domain-containing protein [Corynebacterium macginleyi]MBK4174868.1 CAP domain-containing protein [Corynebacterium macginleyi]MBM0244331.1 CAP domain-containing protein [Corynebacterium macginleyi]